MPCLPLNTNISKTELNSFFPECLLFAYLILSTSPSSFVLTQLVSSMSFLIPVLYHQAQLSTNDLSIISVPPLQLTSALLQQPPVGLCLHSSLIPSHCILHWYANTPGHLLINSYVFSVFCCCASKIHVSFLGIRGPPWLVSAIFTCFPVK